MLLRGKNAQGISNGIGFNKDWNNPTTILKKQNSFKRLRSILESPSKPQIEY